jgi:hypothetical protein
MKKKNPLVTFTILALTKLFSINGGFSQNQLLAMWKVLEICLTLIYTIVPWQLQHQIYYFQKF